MGEIRYLDIVTRLDIPPERVIERAGSVGLKGVVILGYTEDGAEYFASSFADGAEVIWLLERLKRELLIRGDGEDPTGSPVNRGG